MELLRIGAPAFVLVLICSTLAAQESQNEKNKPRILQGQTLAKKGLSTDAAKGRTAVPAKTVQPKQVVRTPQQQQDQQTLQRRAWQERRANHFQYEHKDWKARGGYKGLLIADDYFQAHYGKAHVFRMYDLPFVYENGDPKFQVDGYWFTMLDPYPENWSGYWYETDDLFVDFRDGGYSLFNRGFPNQAGIALDVSL